MAIVTKVHTFNAGAVVVASEHNTNFDVLINDYNGNITNANLSASAGIVDTKLAQITTANKVSGTALVNHFPQRWTMWHDEMTKIAGDSFIISIDTDCRYNFYFRRNSGNNGDSFSNSFFLKAGDYTFSVLGKTDDDNGLIDWYVDGVKVVSVQDWYSVTEVSNVVKTASVTITGDGYHQLIGTVNGKNVSSSNYKTPFTSYWLKPAADGARS